MLVLLLVEQTVLLPLGASASFWHSHRWTWWVLAPEKSVPTTFIIAVAGASLISWETLRTALRSLVREPSRLSINWFFVHLGIVAALLGWTTLCRGNQIYPSPYWEIWIWVRLSLELLMLASWAAAALPPSFWLRWFTSSPSAFGAAMAFALITKTFGHYTENLWSLFQGSTLLAVAAVLRLCGQIVVIGPASNQIGTPTFFVEVSAYCSGFEGLGVMMAFLGFYFWIYRRELRFPQVFLLIPIGIALEWFLNSVRIAGLILLGSWNETAVEKNFHSIAGWLFASAVAFMLVTASWRVPAFTKLDHQEKPRPLSNPAAVFLVPLLTIIATAMVTGILYGGFDLLYPLRVFATASWFYFYRRELAAIHWSASLSAVALGVLIFVMWVALAPPIDQSVNATFAAGLSKMSPWGRSSWFFFRVVGAVVTVPIAEELAFRGYVMRKLIANDFESVGLGQFTWISFLASSILFGILHGEWLAGTLAGMGFAVALYRKRLLSEAIVAHSVANALLSAYVLATHNWSLWT